MQYHPLCPPEAVKLKVQKTRNLLMLNALHPCADKKLLFCRSKPSEACECTNHPSSAIPSRDFTSALTVPGLAFPPVAFIT